MSDKRFEAAEHYFCWTLYDRLDDNGKLLVLSRALQSPRTRFLINGELDVRGVSLHEWLRVEAWFGVEFADSLIAEFARRPALSDAGEAEQPIAKGQWAITALQGELAIRRELEAQLAEVTKERDMLIEGLDDIHANLRTILDSAPRSAGQAS